MTVDCPQAHWFEREIAEQWKVEPQGQTWLKPIRFHASYRTSDSEQAPIPRAADFFTVDGDEVHQVAVGPVHAGITEPGHFRFQCHGERVLHLEISLGYQHRGIERALVGGPGKRTIHQIETLSGDASVGHATAYCEAIESLSGVAVSARAQVLRGIALELERMANHTGDLRALAGDVEYLPTAAYCGRIRWDFLNLTAAIYGSRFGRGMIRRGGVAFDVDSKLAAELVRRLDKALEDAEDAVRLMWNAPFVQAGFRIPAGSHCKLVRRSDSWAPRPVPAMLNAISVRTFRAASSDLRRSPYPNGTPATFSPAPGSDGWKSNVPGFLLESNLPRYQMAPFGLRLGHSGPLAWSFP